jgi:hypothetical protein
MTTMTEYMETLNKQGVASPNRYIATFTLPAGISASGLNNKDVNEKATGLGIQQFNKEINSGGDLSIKCSTMQFPSRYFMTNENRHFDTPYKIPYAPQYDMAQFTFIASKDLRERRFFEIWQEAITNVSTGSMNFYEEYVGVCKMYQLDREMNKVYGVELLEAYPLNIGSVDYAYATTNEIVNITVTMAYRRWNNLESELSSTT